MLNLSRIPLCVCCDACCDACCKSRGGMQHSYKRLGNVLARLRGWEFFIQYGERSRMTVERYERGNGAVIPVDLQGLGYWGCRGAVHRITDHDDVCGGMIGVFLVHSSLTGVIALICTPRVLR